MSQFAIPGAPSVPSDQPAFESGKTSGLAISSLICSLIFCCPLTTIIGPFLGLGAFIQIGRNPALKGRGIALTGIVLGVLFTVGQGFCGYWMYDTIVVPMVVGPREALATGFSGDIPGFKSHFYGRGATASDAEAEAFIEALRERYGEFVNSRFTPGQQPQSSGPIMSFEYTLTFEDQTVSAEAEIVYVDEQTGAWPKKLGYITVFDADVGDLTFPPSEGGASGGEAQPAPATAPASDEDEPGGGE